MTNASHPSKIRRVRNLNLTGWQPLPEERSHIKGILLGKKMRLPSSTRPTIKSFQLICIHFILVHLFYGFTERLCPDPIVGLGARLSPINSMT